MQLGFALGKTVDELECADEFWITRMLMDLEARNIASPKRTDKEFYMSILELEEKGAGDGRP